MFYSYIHFTPDLTPFYVGKGHGPRWAALSPKHRNFLHAKLVRKYGQENILKTKIDCSSEEIAFELEKGLIKCFKRNGIKLTNLTDGGEGMYGHAPTPETRKKLSDALKGKPKTEEHKIKVGIANKGKVRSLEHKAAVSKAQKGRKATFEARMKISLGNKGKEKPKVICPHCQKIGGISTMRRWHFDNCKEQSNG